MAKDVHVLFAACDEFASGDVRVPLGQAFMHLHEAIDLLQAAVDGVESQRGGSDER
ncbi:MAG: hypothetical protein Q4P71_09000 [Actinomycetaceae bacterium]|nr:hypothetical protein [Actinomycetaceae bacterium]